MDNPVSVSFLITKPDYADFKTAAAKACVKKTELNILRITGCALLLAAMLLRGFYSLGFYQNVIYTVMGVVGVVVAAYYDFLLHYFVRRRAFNYYEANKEKFTAQNTEFTPDSVQFKTDRYSAAIPYAFFHKAYEDGRVFILYTGIDEMKFIPKRAMSEDECSQVRALLQTKLQEKYQQEGAR